MIICMKTRSSIYVSKGLGSNGDIIADDGGKKNRRVQFSVWTAAHWGLMVFLDAEATEDPK